MTDPINFSPIVDENGREELGPVTEIEKNDGRPVPDNCRYVEIDCIDNPVLCLNLEDPIIDEEEEDLQVKRHQHRCNYCDRIQIYISNTSVTISVL